MNNKQGIFVPQSHTVGNMPCVKMCESIEQVLKVRVSFNFDTFIP